MGWRSTDDSKAAEIGGQGEVGADGLGPLRARGREVSAQERAQIEAGLASVTAEGVDLDDLASIGAGFDAAYTMWAESTKRRREPSEAITSRYAAAIGEHLARVTDLRWRMVTDIFGTDLAVSDQGDDFVVVPSNLVAARWMRGETGWIPAVVGHLVALRADPR